MEAETLTSFHTHPSLQNNPFQVEEQANGRCLAGLGFSAGCFGVEHQTFVKGTERVHYRSAPVGKPSSAFSTQSCKLQCWKDRILLVKENSRVALFTHQLGLVEKVGLGVVT